MNINQRLEELYNLHFDALMNSLKTLGEQSSSSPLLLKIDEKKWDEAQVKIVIFGQETRGWVKDSERQNVLDLMDTYYNFYYKKQYNNARGKAFFNGFERVQKHIKKSPEYYDRNVEVVWNNINKIGKYAGTGVKDITRELERENFNVISKEMEILKPDLVIFFTGPSRDGDIRHNFPNAIIEKRLTEAYGAKPKKGKYAVVKGYDFKAIRLYHPACFGKCTNVYLQHAIKDWLK